MRACMDDEHVKKLLLDRPDGALEEYDAKYEKEAPVASVTVGPEGELELPNGRGRITYVREFLSRAEADALLAAVRGARSFKRTAIRFDGQSMLQPRDTAFFGTKVYSYGGEAVRRPTEWDDDAPASTAIRALGRRIADRLRLPRDWFDLVLANRYNDGRDFMEWHSDNERNLGDEPTIASVSLGAPRRFLVRPRKLALQGEPVDVVEYTLAHGSLLVMAGKMQRFYQHAVPRTDVAACADIRINLTFRKIIDENDLSIHPTEG